MQLVELLRFAIKEGWTYAVFVPYGCRWYDDETKIVARTDTLLYLLLTCKKFKSLNHNGWKWSKCGRISPIQYSTNKEIELYKSTSTKIFEIRKKKMWHLNAVIKRKNSKSTIKKEEIKQEICP